MSAGTSPFLLHPTELRHAIRKSWSWVGGQEGVTGQGCLTHNGHGHTQVRVVLVAGAVAGVNSTDPLSTACVSKYDSHS